MELTKASFHQEKVVIIFFKQKVNNTFSLGDWSKMFPSQNGE